MFAKLLKWKIACLTAFLWAAQAVWCLVALHAGKADGHIVSRYRLGWSAASGCAMFLLFLVSVKWFARATRLLFGFLVAAWLGILATGGQAGSLLATLAVAAFLVLWIVLLSREIALNDR